MELDSVAVEQAEKAPLRTLPMIRKARRPRRPVFRASADCALDEQIYEFDGMGSYMSRSDNKKNKYGEDDMSVDDILSEFHSGALFSDFNLDEYEQEEEPARKSEPEYAPEIDSRFNLGGRRRAESQPRTTRDYDYSEDEDYVPPQDTRQDTRRARRTEEVEEAHDDYDDYEDLPKAKSKKSLFSFSKKKDKVKEKKRSGYQPKYMAEEIDEEEAEEESFASDFRDVTGELNGYAEAEEEEASAQDEADYSDEERSEGYAPPTFREYLASVFATAFFRIRGTARGDTADTMVDVDEDLGAEVSCEKAYKYYGSYVHPAKIRFRIGCVLLFIMAYLSLGLPIPGMLGYLPVSASMCMALQFTIMLLALDIVTSGLLKIAKLRMGADSLAVISCLVTSIDAAIVALSDGGANHMPLCVLSSIALMCVMYSSLLSARALRKTLRVPAIGKHTYSIVADDSIKGKDITLVKTSRPATGFVRRSEEAAPDETVYTKIAPFLLAAALVFALIVSVVTHNYYDIIYIFSATLVPAVPFTALLCFALPFFIGSRRIFNNAAAIAGWSGLCDVGTSNNLIVTDRDIFPEGSISIESIRIFADEDAQKVISYAGSMIIASGCSMSKAFSDEMEQNGCGILPIDNFEYLSGGGMKGNIDGHVVLCGSSDLMRLMNVRIPFRLVDKTSVLLAIDGVLYGIFAMNYEALPQVRKALVDLMRSNRHPVFALRDFNITPEMLKSTFDIATDGYDFPPYVERFKITETEPSENSKIAAVVCREGLASVTSMADTGKSMYTATRINVVISVLSAVLGMLIMFVKMLGGSIGLSFILTYMLLAAIPVIVVSVFMKF